MYVYVYVCVCIFLFDLCNPVRMCFITDALFAISRIFPNLWAVCVHYDIHVVLALLLF